MATTSDYLTQLQADKQTLVNNLIEKGVEANTNETFTSLVPKVLDIKSGGGELERGVIINACDENGWITDVTVKGILNMPTYFMRYAFNSSRNKWSGANLILRIKDISIMAPQGFSYNNMVKKIIINNCKLSQNCFDNCTATEEVIFETNISYIPNSCFQNCSALKKMSFPNNTVVPDITTSSFQNDNAIETIEVPSALVDSWKAATNWSNYGDKIVGI